MNTWLFFHDFTSSRSLDSWHQVSCYPWWICPLDDLLHVVLPVFSFLVNIYCWTNPRQFVKNGTHALLFLCLKTRKFPFEKMKYVKWYFDCNEKLECIAVAIFPVLVTLRCVSIVNWNSVNHALFPAVLSLPLYQEGNSPAMRFRYLVSNFHPWSCSPIVANRFCCGWAGVILFLVGLFNMEFIMGKCNHSKYDIATVHWVEPIVQLNE